MLRFAHKDCVSPLFIAFSAAKNFGSARKVYDAFLNPPWLFAGALGIGC
jgi:hypothetical protein